MMKFQIKERESARNSQYEPNQQGISQSNVTQRKQKMKLKIKKKKLSMISNNGAWEIQEQRMFLNFMQLNQHKFENKTERRKNHVFKMMAQFLKSRTSQQCRSHHQKYEIRFGTFSNIIDHIAHKLENHGLSQNNVKFSLKNKRHTNQKENQRTKCMNLGSYGLSNGQIVEYILQSQPKFVSQISQSRNSRLNFAQSAELISSGQGYRVLQFISPNFEIGIFLDLDVFLKN